MIQAHLPSWLSYLNFAEINKETVSTGKKHLNTPASGAWTIYLSSIYSVIEA